MRHHTRAIAVEVETEKRLEGWDPEEVFKALFALADPDIRYCVLASLDERFDAHLAQAENLQALFVALNDQVFEIRELAICTVGRLSSMNPAFVMPFLRKMLIQVMAGRQGGADLHSEGRPGDREGRRRETLYHVMFAPRVWVSQLWVTVRV